MKSKNIHNRRTFDIIHLQQQISHYNHLIQVKPDVSMGDGLQQATPSRLRSKFYNELERSRLLENGKLVRKLTEIKHSKGLLHEDNYRERSSKASTSLQSDYKLIEEEKLRLRHNEMLLGKLKSVRPQVGTCYQWNEHYEQFQKNERKLSKVNIDLANLEDRFYNTYANMTSKRGRSRKKLVSEHSKRSTTTAQNKSLKPCQHCMNGQRVMPEQYANDSAYASEKPSKVVQAEQSLDEVYEESRQAVTRGNSLNNSQKKLKRRRKRKQRKQKQTTEQQQPPASAAPASIPRHAKGADNSLQMYGSHS